MSHYKLYSYVQLQSLVMELLNVEFCVTDAQFVIGEAMVTAFTALAMSKLSSYNNYSSYNNI